MARFEVFIPAQEPDGMSLTLRVTADTWMAALKVGLKKIGVAGGMPQNVLCDVQDDESIHVTDPRTNAVFRIVEIPEFSDPGKPMPQGAAQQPDPAHAQQELVRLAAQRAAQVNAEAIAARAAAQARGEAETKAAAERAVLEKQLVQLQAEAKAAAERAVAAEARATAALQTAAERAAEEQRAADAARVAETRRAAEAKAAAEARDRASRAAQERAAAERASQEKAAAEKAAHDRVAAARAAAEKAAQERAAAERASAAKDAAEKVAAEKVVQAKAAAEKLRAEKLAVARAAIEKSVAARSAAEVQAALAGDTRPDAKPVARTPLPPGAVKVVEAPWPRNQPPAQIGRVGEVGDVAAVEDVLIDLFERTPAVFEKPLNEALYFLLDLALEKIPADSGSVYVADLNRRDLRFAAARGPKAAELLKLDVRVPMGRGFVGFCAQEGVAVAISDAQRDKRFYGDVSEKLGYATRSVLTTPIIAGGRTLGAVQLINKQGSSSFTPGELAVLHYISLQAARYLEAHDD